jgi:lipid A 3-O-deacylase
LKKNTFRILLILLCSCASSGILPAQEYKYQYATTIDNDQYINPNHDRYYTDGTLLSLTYAAKKPAPDRKLIKKVIEFQFGQQIYNSRTAHVYCSCVFDRPLTGYLFANGSFDWFYRNESALKLTIQLGTIGPNALGQQVQDAFHNLFDLYPAGPWPKYELNNAFGAELDLDYKKMLYKTSGDWFDIAADPEAMLGNTFTLVNAGMQLRLGNLGKLYESASTNSRVTNDRDNTLKHEFYFFAEPQLSYVAYNATIEGGLFIKDKGPTFDIYHIVYVQQLGLQFASARWSASYTAFIKTREVKSTALGDQWGSIGIAYRFRKI